jgi:hypothetical protein
LTIASVATNPGGACFFPALNIPEDELWEALERVFALIEP